MNEVVLNDICELIVDCPHSTAYDEGTGYPLVRTPNIGRGRLIYSGMHRVCEEVYNKRNARAIPQTNDLIFAREATAGNVALIQEGEKVCLGQRTVLIRPNANLVNPAFLTYHLLAPEQQYKLLSTANGATVAHVNMPTIRNLKLSLPPLATQHRIASILSRYDSLIENYQKQIKLLEEAAQRLYKEWFVDLHFPGHENTKIVDGVPEGWEKKKISDICQTVGGGTPSTKVAEYYDDGNIKWVTPTDITRSNCLCLFDTDKKITEDGLAHSSAKILPPETILMTSRASVGYFGIYDCEVCTNQGFISCIPNERSYQMYMLYNLMNRVEEIRQKAGGSTYLEISKSVFRDFDIVLPSCMVLETFQEQSHKMLDCMRQIAKQLRLLTEARDRLLPKLMSGAIEV